MIISTFSAFAQYHLSDSLKNYLATAPDDTNKIYSLSDLSWEYMNSGDIANAMKCASKGNFISLKIGSYKGSAMCYGMMGEIFEQQKNFEKALLYYNYSLDFYKKAKAEKGICFALENIGRTYNLTGNYDKGIGYCIEAIERRNKLKDTLSLASSYNDVGLMLSEKGDYNKAIGYLLQGIKFYELKNEVNGAAKAKLNSGIVYHKLKNDSISMKFFSEALKNFKEAGNDQGLASTLVNIGNVCFEGKNLVVALAYYNKALAIYKKLNNQYKQAFCYVNMASIYGELKNYLKAIEYYNLSLNIFKNSGDKKNTSGTLTGMSIIKMKQNNIPEAEKDASEGLKIATEINSKEDMESAYRALSSISEAKKDYKKAFDFQNDYVAVHDTLYSESTGKQMHEMEAKYQSEKKDNEIKLLNKDNEKQAALAAAENKKHRIILIAVSLGLLFVLIFAIFILRSYNQKRKANNIITLQKEEVEHQKHLVEEKNKEITDSISYAKRLQQAILPPQKMISTHLNDNFVLYKPKDIVAGDFYWMEVKNDLVLIAAADCTGHGVPGAMVSVVCSNALNRTVKEFGIIDPGKVLDKVRELVIETFEKSESEVKDGMDISLCSINIKSAEVKWAGANNPLWYIHEGTMNEIKANKQPIGKTDTPLPFTTNQLQLYKGDQLYLFTDGYADQFGGEKGKKFKYKPFQDMLTSIAKQSMNEQRKIIDETIENWKGDLEQVDDILVIGIRI